MDVPRPNTIERVRRRAHELMRVALALSIAGV